MRDFWTRTHLVWENETIFPASTSRCPRYHGLDKKAFDASPLRSHCASILPYTFQNDKHLSNDKLSQTASLHDAWQAVSSYPNMTTTTAANLKGRVYPKYHGSTPMLRGPCSRDETKRLPFIKHHSCYLLLPFLVSTAKVMY